MNTTYAARSLDERALDTHWPLRSWFLYVLLPLLTLAAVLAAAHIGGSVRYWTLGSRVGVMESLTGALALAAGIVSLFAFFQPTIRRDWKVRTWLFAFFIAMVYFAGEDLNWGQYYFGWASPEYFQLHNKENETNLHNMSHWFNQKPRQVLQLWLVVACILVPLGWSLPKRLTARFVPAMFWPDARLVLIAALAMLIEVVDLLSKSGFIPRTLRWSEVQEIYFVYACLFYAILMLARVRRREDTASL
jgi:hypothetical protein